MPIPKGFTSPSRITAKERALNQIQRWIIEGTLEPGEKIYDAEISEALGISRTPVREALLLLETQGLIEMHPGKETKVTTITKEDVTKIYPPLATLHALAAEEVAETIPSEKIEQLKEINHQFELAIQLNEPYKAMETDEQFHNLIIELADNSYISHFCSILDLHVRRLKYLFLTQEIVSKEDSIHEHRLLIQAFLEHDKEKAAIIMKQNWIGPLKNVYRLMEQQERGE
ncbi:GntR family transcriptional regulator [Chengkuizengella axinellae]|uniref:GntR family transcriptional regulator n=1 Tax=Chengkuizengella axinellae TaxID=3064388 RepID=A0ABT9J713_9BACL|nr:GntR family transcriptional regulator [Chengkuizengella sp. 2205SS18-9]MDP5276810.1 GntR family transcriptional regulator [Chengkuizengella sp. 2205SS18-9]